MSILWKLKEYQNLRNQAEWQQFSIFLQIFGTEKEIQILQTLDQEAAAQNVENLQSEIIANTRKLLIE